MLIEESHVDVPTSADGKTSSMRIFLFHPKIPGYPNAKFPAVCVFSEIYQVTGPVARFARQIAGHGYICAAPSSYHDFVGPEPLAYDAADTDRGNQFKIDKTLASYDEDSRQTVNHLLSMPTCSGLVGATGMCLGGHLAVRAALDPRIKACVSYFGTDIHKRALGPHEAPNESPESPSPESPHTLDNLNLLTRSGREGSSPNPLHPNVVSPSSPTECELALIFGVRDNHVPPAGRDLVRAKLREAGACFSFYEFAWAQHAFIRDELSKGRYDPAITKVCFEILLELFGRTLRGNLGDAASADRPGDDC